MVQNAVHESALPAAKGAPCSSLKQFVYEEIKRRIISGEIPPGTQLTEEAICESLNASRTPVRDALSRLEQEHLLSIQSKKGILVNTVSLSNVNELFEARLRIEPYAVQHYGNRIRDEVYVDYINYFRGEHARAELYQRDDAFHQMFIDATHNRYLKQFYKVTKDQVMRFRVLSDIRDRTRESTQEHCEIVMHCLRGNWAQAAESMRVHIENSKISIVQYVIENNKDAKNIFAEMNQNQDESGMNTILKSND